MLWAVLFGFLWLIALVIPFFRYNRFFTALMAPTIKLVYVSAPAIGILGMAHGLGGKK